MANKEIPLFKSGIHNLLQDEVIPTDASSGSENWYTQDGKIKLIPGKLLVGAAGVAGKVTGEIFGYKSDGTQIHWRKIGTKIQYLDGSTWTDTVTGLTSDADYTFTNYSSLAGSFTYAFGIDGIYKFNNANPGSYNSMYNATINYKGHAFIDKGRAILWNVPNDKTGLYISHIDYQDSYTDVSGEALAAVESGTLAFKAGGATRNCFGVVITDTSSGEVFTDNLDGTLTGDAGGSGTINYMTGAFTITGQTGAGTADYSWEDSNSNGVTDFTFSGTRLAGEGDTYPQDEGGDPIQVVLIGQDGAYYSMKEQSAYRVSIDADDLGATNEVFRKEIGVLSLRGALSTGKGIIFMNTSNREKPEMTILKKNVVGDAVEPKPLLQHFAFQNYNFDDATVDAYDRYIIIACKTADATNNDTILLCDLDVKTVDVVGYNARTFARSAGLLYMGSSLAESVYQLFTGADDDGFSIENYWEGKGETWGASKLKKYKKIRLKGTISKDQSYGVYVDYDGEGSQLVGTVLGTGSYVDYSSPQSIGANEIGSAQIGGDDLEDLFPYFVEIRLKKVPKFRKRKITFKALGLGYVDIESQTDVDISLFEDKIPKRNRQKQNVNLAGTTTDNANPEF